MHLNHEQFGQFIAKQEAGMKNMPGTRLALKPLKDLYSKGGGADLTVDRAGDGGMVSFSAKAGGGSDWENFSLSRQGYDKLNEALTETDIGNRYANKNVHDTQDVIKSGTSRTDGVQINADSAWTDAVSNKQALVDLIK